MLAPDVVTKLPNVFFAVKHKNRLFPPPASPTSFPENRSQPRGDTCWEAAQCELRLRPEPLRATHLSETGLRAQAQAGTAPHHR